jgi:alanine dehydrogenase
MRVLGRADLERLLPPADLVDAMAAAFRRLADGACTVPPRGVMPAGEGLLLVMPAVAPGGDDGGLGAKLVTYYAGNRRRGLPTLHASYVLMDEASGRPLALLEGTLLTALRTGATSALAARYLARADAGRVACFGAGTQAAFQLRCLATVRRLRRVAVVGRDPGRARAFAAAMGSELGVPVEVAADPPAALREADLVTCATTSATPVVAGALLSPGTHIDLVGAFRPTDREADTETIRRARVVVDTYAGAFEEAGDIVLPIAEGAVDRDHVTAELAEIVSGRRPGRRAPDEITLFKSVGWALEDLAAARLAYNRAMSRDVGTEVELG